MRKLHRRNGEASSSSVPNIDNSFGSRTEEWMLQRRARDTKRDGRALVASTLAALVMQVLLTFQFAFGVLRRFSFSDSVVTLLLITTVLTMVAAIAAPVTTSRFLAKVLKSFGEKVFTVITVTILTAFYVMTLPFAYVWGRKSFVKRHRAAASWVGAGDWRTSTWTAKRSEAEQANRHSRSTALRALRLFAEQKNWFLLIVASFLILLASVVAFANSPVVAPFIYTLF